MKCVLTTLLAADRSVGSSVVARAIKVIDIDEVFVARMVWEAQIFAREAKMDCLRETISGTASITISTSPRSDMEVVVVRRERVASASDCVMRSLETSLESNLSARVLSRSNKYMLP